MNTLLPPCRMTLVTSSLTMSEQSSIKRSSPHRPSSRRTTDRAAATLLSTAGRRHSTVRTGGVSSGTAPNGRVTAPPSTMGALPQLTIRTRGTDVNGIRRKKRPIVTPPTVRFARHRRAAPDECPAHLISHRLLIHHGSHPGRPHLMIKKQNEI